MSNENQIDTAWRIHAAQVDWTGKVDSKASFALAIQSAVLASVINLSGSNRRLAHIKGPWPNAFYWAGIFVLVSALLAVSFVVAPRLRARQLETETSDNFIFFGHLRNWNSEDLELAIGERDLLPVLSRQITEMSKVAWRKHRLLQASMAGAVTGTAFVAIAGLLRP